MVKASSRLVVSRGVNSDLEIEFVFRSLGCIIYELVVGSPPFQTNSILHLIKLIRFEAIKWPDFISANCKNFLQVRKI